MTTAASVDSLVVRIQELLRAAQIPGWLFYDFRGQDPIARRILRFPPRGHETRRWFYLVPATGEPVKLIHRVEPHTLPHLPGRRVLYAGWRELEDRLKEILAGYRAVAMQYSPRCAIPYISKVDAGTVELVRNAGAEVRSSADLVQQFEAVWTPTQLTSHEQAARDLREIVDRTFAEIGRRARSPKSTSEYEIQQYMMDLFRERRLITDHPPIVAANEHSGNPHYAPSAEESAPIKPGDFVLIDLWAKLAEPEEAVYADITWTGFVGETPPERHREIFEIVRLARDSAITLVTKTVSDGKPLHGWEVDDAARKYITERGYGEQFVHRTGHSIGREVHWNGANIDNFETRDERRILPRTCFSIEPGVYLKEFGVRSEVDVYVGEREVLVTGQPIQTLLVTC